MYQELYQYLGATNTSYTPLSTVAGTTYYRVIISASASGCDAALSQVVTAIITNDIAITLQPVGGSICVGGNLTLTVAATGSPGLNYDWQRQAGANWISVGTNSPTYNTGSLTSTTVYRVLVYAPQSGCETAISALATVIVAPDIEITSQPTGGAICTGGDMTLNRFGYRLSGPQLSMAISIRHQLDQYRNQSTYLQYRRPHGYNSLPGISICNSKWLRNRSIK
jgi:hypothetical protein